MYMYVFAEICMYTMYVKGLPFFLALFQLFFQYYQILYSCDVYDGPPFS